MANGDSLHDLIEIAKRENPDMPSEFWEKFALLASLHFGGSRVYINAPNRKRARLEMLAQLDADLDIQTLAAKLGVSVRRAQQLRRLR